MTPLSKLIELLDAIQDYADAQGPLFDDEDRDDIDAALKTLLHCLDGWGRLADQVPARCLDWRVRLDAHEQMRAIDVTIEPAQLSDRRCPAGNHLLGAEAFWCLTCNAYANDLA